MWTIIKIDRKKIHLLMKDFEDKLGGVIQNVAEKMNYIKKDDYETLQKRVKDLEAEIAKNKEKKAPVKSATK